MGKGRELRGRQLRLELDGGGSGFWIAGVGRDRKPLVRLGRIFRQAGARRIEHAQVVLGIDDSAFSGLLEPPSRRHRVLGAAFAAEIVQSQIVHRGRISGLRSATRPLASFGQVQRDPRFPRLIEMREEKLRRRISAISDRPHMREGSGLLLLDASRSVHIVIRDRALGRRRG